MNPSKTLLAALLLAAVLPAQARERIVALSPDVADVLVALGATQDIVGRDQTSTNPALKNVKSIGIFRQLSPEPVAALKPTLAVGSWMVQPPSVYQRLNQLGIKAVNVAPQNRPADRQKQRSRRPGRPLAGGRRPAAGHRQTLSSELRRPAGGG